MIRTLSIKNFKRFRELSISLRSLTILTGRNGSGKSSVIQGALLLRQSAQAFLAGRDTVALNEVDGLQLGEAAEVLSTSAGEPIISLSAEVVDGGSAAWT